MCYARKSLYTLRHTSITELRLHQNKRIGTHHAVCADRPRYRCEHSKRGKRRCRRRCHIKANRVDIRVYHAAYRTVIAVGAVVPRMYHYKKERRKYGKAEQYRRYRKKRSMLFSCHISHSSLQCLHFMRSSISSPEPASVQPATSAMILRLVSLSAA